MTRFRLSGGVLCALAATTLAAGCATTPSDASEPSVRTVEVVVTKPVPCPALAALGPEPAYADSPEAIASAAGIGELSRLYAVGRMQRVQRLAEYVAAAAACNF